MDLLIIFLISVLLFSIGYYLQYKDYLDVGFDKIITGTKKSTFSYLLLLFSGGGFIKLVGRLIEDGIIDFALLNNWIISGYILPLLIMVLVTIPPLFYAFHMAKLRKVNS